MKIGNNLKTGNYFENKLSRTKTNNSLFHPEMKINGSIPSTKQYLAFCGGYTLNIKEIYNNLEPEEYPQGIRENAEHAIDNSINIGLYDIHFAKYKGVEDCYTLKELKEKFPEFKDVVSSFDVEAKENSFLGEFQKGENEIFTSEEDLTLQLIKLYWGKGFSLTDLSKYIEENSTKGKEFNIHYLMTKKLNIPLMNRRYAVVLKLSNKEYNEKFKSEMSVKLREAKEAKKQRAEGEPVIIPKGPLSEAHKQHISEGLKKYYSENPDAIYRLTKRQKEFIDNNPEFKETMSEVMEYAWNSTQEGMSVKRHLSKFMKKFYRISDKQLTLEEEMTDEQKKALKEFWDKNFWAKQSFSKAVRKGWEYIKYSPIRFFSSESISGYRISLSLMPRQMRDNIINWANKKGYNIKKDENFSYMIAMKDEDMPKESEEIQKYQDKFDTIIRKHEMVNPDMSNDNATALQYSLIRLINEVKTNSPNLPKSVRDSEIAMMTLTAIFNSFNSAVPLYRQFNGFSMFPVDGIETQTIYKLYDVLANTLISMDCGADIANYLNNNLDSIYDCLKTKGKFTQLLEYFR